MQKHGTEIAYEKVTVKQSGPAQPGMNMNKEIKNSSKFQDLTIISGNDRKATRRFSPKLSTDLVLDQNGTWIPVGVTDGKFQAYTTYARLHQ
jgi:hypothetical protein